MPQDDYYDNIKSGSKRRWLQNFNRYSLKKKIGMTCQVSEIWTTGLNSCQGIVCFVRTYTIFFF